MLENYTLLHQIIANVGFVHLTSGHVVMWGIAFLFIYLAIKKGFEPLLLLPIGFGILIVNLPLAPIMGISEGPHGPQRDLIRWFYDFGIAT